MLTSISGTNPFRNHLGAATLSVDGNRLFTKSPTGKEHSLGAFVTNGIPLEISIVPSDQPDAQGPMCRVTVNAVGGLVILKDIAPEAARSFAAAASALLVASGTYPSGSCQRCGRSKIAQCDTLGHRAISPENLASYRADCWREYVNRATTPAPHVAASSPRAATRAHRLFSR